MITFLACAFTVLAPSQAAMINVQDGLVHFEGSQAFVFAPNGDYVVRLLEEPPVVRMREPSVADIGGGGWGAVVSAAPPAEGLFGTPFEYIIYDIEDGELRSWCEGSYPNGSETCYEVREVPEPAAWITCVIALSIAGWAIWRVKRVKL